jgi:hypothetical protein
MHAYEI